MEVFACEDEKFKIDISTTDVNRSKRGGESEGEGSEKTHQKLRQRRDREDLWIRRGEGREYLDRLLESSELGKGISTSVDGLPRNVA